MGTGTIHALSAPPARSGLAEYVAAVRLFSRNARLYLVHIMGMDLIHGTWEVLFNLYLLALFTPAGGVQLFGRHFHPIEFVGLRLAVGAIAGGIGSIPAGFVSDRIGRKASFVIGDGGGALIALLNILVTNPLFLLCTPIVSSVLGNLHHVSETAFMAENSEQRERVHLFSVGRAVSTSVGMVGSLIAASHPALVSWFADHLTAYRVATFAGIALWFLSLIPALLLREQRPGAAPPPSSVPAAGPAAAEAGAGRRVSIGFRSIRHPALVAKLVITGALMSVGYSAALPFLNVFFHEHLHAEEHEIGVTFAAVSGFVAAGSLLAPFVAARFGKVDGVVLVRTLSVPFILLLAFSPEGASDAAIGLSLAGAAVAMRAVLVSLSGPLAEAFAMEILDPSERATMVGIETAAGSVLRAATTFLGSTWMAGGDFRSPFIVAAGCYVAATALFWLFFRRAEARPATKLQPAVTAA
jgi:MFS family permease